MLFIVTFMVASAMLYLQLGSYSSSYIHVTVTGGLISVREIGFGIRVEDLNGVIIYGVDYERNQFAMDVVRGGDGERLIRIKFIKMYAVVPLIGLCGCERCWGNIFIFDIQITSKEMRMRCNWNGNYHLNDTRGGQQRYDGVGARIHYPMPLSMVNQRNKTFFMVGNIGPIVAEGNVTVPPLEEQMVGCLIYFKYNGAYFDGRFVEESSQMRALCPRKCYDGLCNGGKCNDNDPLLYYLPRCDCSSTVLSGLYCNRTLRRYTDGGFNIYKRYKRPIERASMKVTWRVTSTSRYCLAEVAGGGGLSTIVIEGDRLLLDSAYISPIEIFTAKFINIDIGYRDFNIKTKYGQSKGSFPRPITHINIGFSEKSGSCKTFEGLYDVDMMEGDLRQSRRFNKPHHGSVANTFTTAQSTLTEASVTTRKVNAHWLISTTVRISVAFIMAVVYTAMFMVRRINRTRSERSIYKLQEVGNTATQMPRVMSGEYDDHIDPPNQNPRPISAIYDEHVDPLINAPV